MEFVTFEIAKKLKDKGFDWDRITTYNPRTKVRNNHLEPTISQVLEWLRKKKGLHIAINITNFSFISNTTSFKWDKLYCENDIEHYNHEGYSTYEEAALTEIEYVLDNLI